MSVQRSFLTCDHRIEDEIQASSLPQLRAYLLGAAHDGHISKRHRTLRIAQKDVRWLEALASILARLGARSWRYREGARDVHVLETAYLPAPAECLLSDNVAGAGYVRGYFDAEGGVPRDPVARFYIQFVQKDLEDLTGVRDALGRLDISCGVLHNPSSRVDPDYWRFYVRSSSWHDFRLRIGSWHPRKRPILECRLSEGGRGQKSE